MREVPASVVSENAPAAKSMPRLQGKKVAWSASDYNYQEAYFDEEGNERNPWGRYDR